MSSKDMRSGVPASRDAMAASTSAGGVVGVSRAPTTLGTRFQSPTANHSLSASSVPDFSVE